MNKKHIANILIFIPPFLFALASLLNIFGDYSALAEPGQFLRPLIILWIILILLLKPFFWIIGDWNWASIALSITAMILFSSEQYFNYQLISLVGAIVLWYIFFSLLRHKIKIIHVNFVFGLVALLLVISMTINIFNQASWPSVSASLQFQWQDHPLPAKLDLTSIRPDIYYIVLDAYGRADILEEYYDYDNSTFIDGLESKGFIVPTQSRSNYSKTILSLPSTLNMDYISNLVPGTEYPSYWWLMAPLIQHSDVRHMLENIGYRSVAITADYNFNSVFTSDFYFQPEPVILYDLEARFIDRTPISFLSPLLSKVAFYPLSSDHEKLILYNFETLSSIPNLEGPKFIFAHIAAPHPPFVFDETGHSQKIGYDNMFTDGSTIPMSDEDYKIRYIAQLEFINAQVAKTIDSILANSTTPPIIIVQADHGPRMYTDFDSEKDTCLKEAFSVFAAYYLPGIDPEAIPPDICSVNLFRIIFNNYFGTDMDLLNRKHYFDTSRLYMPEDVTSHVDTCARP